MASYALLADLKARLGISGTTEDTFLQSLLDAATTAIDNHCNTTFGGIATVTAEKHDGEGSRFLRLNKRPAAAISSITIDGSAIDADSYELSESGWAVIPECSEDSYNPRLGHADDQFVWPRGTNNIAVTYTYGYASAPAPVVAACLMLAVQYYRAVGAAGIQAESMGPRSITYVTGQGISGVAAQLLAAYVEHRIGG